MSMNAKKLSKVWFAYYCAVIVLILQDKGVRYKTKEIIEDYNLDIILSKEVDATRFFNIITCFLNLQSYSSNVVVLTVKFKISNRKQETAKFLLDDISENLDGKLWNFDKNVFNINREYLQAVLSPKNIKLLNKPEKLNKLY